MAGTREGGLKAAKQNYRRYGDDFYIRTGRLGGQAKVKKGFAVNRAVAARAGVQGGHNSRRGYAAKKIIAGGYEDKFKGILIKVIWRAIDLCEAFPDELCYPMGEEEKIDNPYLLYSKFLNFPTGDMLLEQTVVYHRLLASLALRKALKAQLDADDSTDDERTVYALFSGIIKQVLREFNSEREDGEKVSRPGFSVIDRFYDAHKKDIEYAAKLIKESISGS